MKYPIGGGNAKRNLEEINAMASDTTIGAVMPSGGSGGLLGQIEQELQQLMQKFEQEMSGGGQQGSQDPFNTQGSQDPFNTQGSTNSPSLSSLSGGSPDAGSIGSTSDSNGALDKLSLLSTIDTALKELSGDKTPGSNEFDRMGDELKGIDKLASVLSGLEGLATHSQEPTTLAGTSLLQNKTTVL